MSDGLYAWCDEKNSFVALLGDNHEHDHGPGPSHGSVELLSEQVGGGSGREIGSSVFWAAYGTLLTRHDTTVSGVC